MSCSEKDSIRDGGSTEKLLTLLYSLYIAYFQDCSHCLHCFHCFHHVHSLHCLHYIHCLGKDLATNSDEFLEKCQGGGVIFNPKIHIADFGNFKLVFLSMSSGYVFSSTIVLILTDTIWPMPCINATISNIKHRKNCECCPGHYLIVDHYSSI